MRTVILMVLLAAFVALLPSVISVVVTLMAPEVTLIELPEGTGYSNRGPTWEV